MTTDYRAINRSVIEAFRSGGEIRGMHRDRLLLLTTTGTRTGKAHTTPMMFVRDGDRLVVVAANAGAEDHPHWYRNLIANPQVKVEVGQEAYDATATPLDGDERERVWSALKADFPFFGEYEAKLERTIPVVALERAVAG